MNKVILIVEDDPKCLKLFRDLLEVQGFTILEATNGKQGVEIVKGKKPNLILMDIQMPVMDGTEAIKILKADPNTKEIPTVALTAYAMKEDEEKIRQAGFDGYITKPIDTKEFLKKVSGYFSR